MKKKLEAELISIAHRILKLKNKSDVVALHQETQKLYEILSVLRFVEEKFGDVKPTIGNQEIESKLEEFLDEEPVIQEEVPQSEAEVAPSEETEVAEEAVADEPAKNDEPDVEEVPKETPEIPEIDPEENTEEVPENTDRSSENGEESKDEETEPEESEDKVDEETVTPEQPETEEELEVASQTDDIETSNDTAESTSEKDEFFTPSFELAFDPKTDDAVEVAKDPTPQFSFDDLLGKDYADPVFVKPHENESSSSSNDYFTPPKEVTNSKPASLNDRLSKGIIIGLNDRIAFMNHLFANSSEDYNRVLSQLMTFDTFDEAKNFIDEMVKPDYNNWEGKDDYAQRFMEIVEKRFT